jgi:hypothetical protein
VPSTTYDLGSSDTLTAGLYLTLGPPPGPSPTPAPGWVLSVSTSGSATLTVGEYEFTGLTAQVAADGESFSFKGSVDLPGSSDPGVLMGGSYTTGTSDGGTVGAFSSAPASDATLTLAGFAVSGTPTIARNDGELSATFSGTTSFGLFDGDTSVSLSGSFGVDPTDGTISTILSGGIGATAFRGLQGTTATFRIRPGENPFDTTIGLYLTDVTFQAAPDSCSFWSSDPLFTGATYRDDGTTYYTLAAEVELTWPSGLAVSVPWGQYPQPVVLTNENVPGTQPAPGLTLQAGFADASFTALGMFAFDPVACSYSVGGTLVLEFTTGSQSEALSENTQQGPILQLSQNQFGDGASLPESIQVVRNEFQANQLAAQLATLATQLQTEAQNAAAQLKVASKTTAAFRLEQATVEQELQVANENLAKANQQLSSAQSAAEQAEARAAVSGAQEEVNGAASEVARASAAVSSAAKEQTTAAARSQVYSDMVQYSTEQESQARTALNEAQENVAAVEQAEEEHQTQLHASPVMLTVDWTHCDTCDPVDTFSVDGEVLLGGKVIMGADYEFAFGDDGFVDGSFTLGYQWQVTAGFSRLYAQGLAVVEGTLTVGYSHADGWDELSVDLEGQASLSVYLSLWFATYSATLAELTAEVGLQFIPSPVTVSGSVTVDIFGFDPTFAFGPDEVGSG